MGRPEAGDATKNEISIETIEIAHEGLIYKGWWLIMSDSPQRAAARLRAHAKRRGGFGRAWCRACSGASSGRTGSPIGRALRFADRLDDSVVEGGSAG